MPRVVVLRMGHRVVVLRMGHRVFRDSRMTTHVCLTARALGATGVIIANRPDKDVESSVREVVKRFGGSFQVETGPEWRHVIREWKNQGGRVLHLTAYGLPLPKVIDQVQAVREDLLVVVGSEKMPGEMFRLADWNVSVTSQPMSEVGALAIFLDWYHSHKEFKLDFPGSEMQIIPSKEGKIVKEVSRVAC